MYGILHSRGTFTIVIFKPIIVLQKLAFRSVVIGLVNFIIFISKMCTARTSIFKLL